VCFLALCRVYDKKFLAKWGAIVNHAPFFIELCPRKTRKSQK